MDDDQQFCLRWNNHQSTLISVFDTLLENETLVDCTLAAEGKFLKAHKVVLSACSPYFATLLQEQYDKHPIFILKDVKYQELRAMMDYMYRGEVNISQDQLAALLKAAESLQIKGLSDNRTTTGNANTAPKLDTSHQQQQQHRNLNVPVGGGAGGGGVSGKIGSGYTLEQTKRARLGPNPMDAQEMSGSREGSSSPSRRRRKVRRRSIENALADVHHENSNSSANQTAIQQQSNTVVGASGLSGVSAITAAASALAAAQLPTGALAAAAAAAAVGASPTVGSSTSSSSAANVAPGTTTAAQQMTTSVTKKTDSVKGATSDAMNTENISAAGTAGVSADDQESQPQQPHTKVEKQNHKQKIAASAGGKDTSDMVIEPKSEYDDDGNEGTVEDLTLDDEEMGMDDLDHNAGTSQAGEGSSQGYVPWQHERSQDELLMATQEAQQRDPQDSTKDQSELEHKNNDAKTQSESRIRVRNWLMLADQSLLEKQQVSVQNNPLAIDIALNPTVAETQNSSSTVTNNNNNGNKKIRPKTSTTTTTTTTTRRTVNLPSNKNVTTSTGQTVRRIGSIGRTTIACITPANESVSGAGNGVDVVSAAALAAAGVELDAVPVDCMTEVIVKIENTSCGASDNDNGEEESEELNELRLMLQKNTSKNFDVNANNSMGGDEDGDGEVDDDYNNYALKISSPMSWAYDAVKIEPDEEEFEQMMCVAAAAAVGEDDEPENNTDEDDDDLLTTAAATSKQAAAKVKRNDTLILKTTRGGRQQHMLQQQQLLEQQQHLHHLQLQPNQRNSLQVTLAGIPATISKISNCNAGTASTLSNNNNNINTNNNNNNNNDANNVGNNNQQHKSEYKSSVSEDKRYRILIQNQRMRKESLEHSEDMIYNADIEKPWVCRNCNRNYKWKNSLKCHLKNECGQPPRYFCSKLCGYATNVHSNLKRHLNTKCRDRMDETTYNKSASATTTATTSNTHNAASSSNTTSSSCSNFTLVMQKQD